MLSIEKPKIASVLQRKNELGLSPEDYGGAPSTLCGGCGHDSVTAAIISACFELSIPPENVAKMSGIGCSSKTPAYFLRGAHAFNAVHGRMPSVTTGACAANRDMYYLAVSGDGDTASIGLGQFIHALRRRLNMLYLIENNGIYGLTKGQFSALADAGSRNKQGGMNPFTGIDPVRLAMTLGASFVARGFSGDKEQLIPLIKAGLLHKGFALIDVLSPCVSFNNHADSSRSYDYIRKHEREVNSQVSEDFVPSREEIFLLPEEQKKALRTACLHDGSSVRMRAYPESCYEPDDKQAAFRFLDDCQKEGSIPTGLIYKEAETEDFHDMCGTSQTALRDLPMDGLIPSPETLRHINQQFR
ncbi:MAG: 2-oxoacid:ferredoxin oxidoreductase subunit beta [Deltaproteobacteria bacterium]|nr:2-oxoacid:ferredoxin oxidoreductase subunit beta [Deltaproteobacteria bacterium]